MPDIRPAIPYAWLKYAKNAVGMAMLALNEAEKRMDEMNPLENMEEMAYLLKTRDALKKAVPQLTFIESIQ